MQEIRIALLPPPPPYCDWFLIHPRKPSRTPFPRDFKWSNLKAWRHRRSCMQKQHCAFWYLARQLEVTEKAEEGRPIDKRCTTNKTQRPTRTKDHQKQREDKRKRERPIQNHRQFNMKERIGKREREMKNLQEFARRTPSDSIASPVSRDPLRGTSTLVPSQRHRYSTSLTPSTGFTSSVPASSNPA